MNQRIKELAIQASLKWKEQPPHFLNTSNPIDFPQSANADLEKFAELIVQECVAITNDLVNRSTDGTWTSNELYTDYNGALFEVKRRIKETFGVEK